ncbi:ATP-binding protein [Bacteroides sp.]|uniref:ATP-binding protein n=1 Tax=Bacteroides sp. TaxID=29523 RepID=UPI00262EB81C|nr:ATP-binding protein [Bacteroides sp.]
MNMDKLTLTQIGLYNTQRVTDEQAKKLFIARKKQFEIIMDTLDRTQEDDMPQHQLIIAQRGMGKTTLLKRIEVELRTGPWNKRFIPLLFPEEQYNVRNLSEFWLNCIDALADVIELEHKKEMVSEIDQVVGNLAGITDDNERANEAYGFLIAAAKRLNRRPVLLIDNLSLIFDRMDIKEQHTLRSLMSANGAPLIIGASSIMMEGTTDYQAPFYDAFRIHHLNKLKIEELTEILINLANITHESRVIPSIHLHAARLRALYQLTGGNPRTAVMLFRLILKGFSSDINDDLEALLDEITPIYKARFEELSDQMQIILDAIAMNWEPITLEQLRETTRYENSQLSPQLKRLVDSGWIEKPTNRQGKNGAYEISERIFNIWFLMRRSSRRQKRSVFCLSKFMEAYYGEEIKEIAERCLTSSFTCTKQVIEALAAAKLTPDKKTSEQLYMKSRKFIFDHFQKQPELLDIFDQSDLYEKSDLSSLFNELKDKIDNKDWTTSEFLAETLINRIKNPKLKASICLLIADSLIISEEFDTAEKWSKKALKLDNNNVESYINLAIISHDHKKDYNEVEKWCKKALTANPSNPMGAYFLGKLYHENLGNIQMAEKMFLKAIELKPDDIEFYNSLGFVYFENHNYEKAQKAYSQALLINSNNPISLFYSAYIYHDIGNTSKAIEFYKKIIKKDPHDEIVLYNLATIYKNLKEYNKAEKLYKKVIKINPNDSDAYYNLGDLYELTECNEKAIKIYEKIIESNPQEIDAYINLGALYIVSNDFSKSEIILKKVIEIDSTNVQALIGLGIISEQKKDIEKAIKWYEQSINNTPSSLAYLSLANLYENNQEYSNAEKYYLSALDLEPDRADIWEQFGDLYQYHISNFAKAEEAYLKAQVIENSNSLKYSLIDLYRDRMNRIKEAEEIFLSIDKEEFHNYIYILNQVLFELYNKNEGSAGDLLSTLLKKENATNITNELDNWIYFAGQVYKLGYADFLLNHLSQNEYNISMAPYFYAIKALTTKEPLLYLDTVAAEVRDISIDIVNKIRLKL